MDYSSSAGFFGFRPQNDTEPSLRTFIAIPLPKEVREQLADVQARMKTLDFRATWVNPKIFHLTLQFLGDVEETKIPKVSAAIGKGCCGIEPFELTLERLEFIPNIHRPRVIAVSVDDDLDSFTKLKNQIRVEVETLGFKFEDEKTPHLTLGRTKGNLSPQAKKHLQQDFHPLCFHDSNHVKVSKIVFMQSTLTQTGPVYTPIAEISLDGDLVKS